MHFVYTFVLFSVVCHASVQDGKLSLNEAQVWRTQLWGPSDIILIKKLLDREDISSWRLIPTSAEFLVRIEHRVIVEKELGAHNLTFTVIIPDVQKTVEMQRSTPLLWDERSLRTGHRLNWKSYPTLDIIEEFYSFLAEQFPSICKVQNFGRTSENRTLKLINITNGNPNNKIIVIISGLHGREWIAITSVLYLLHSIVTQFDQQPPHMQNKNWLIIPVGNPDGYHFSYTKNRLWRKNRRKFVTCKGADLNRNFELDWSLPGLVVNGECKEAYAGPYPFSESESVAIGRALTKNRKKATAVVDIHSYGNLILYPWSARSEKTSDAELHKQTALEMTKAIMVESGIRYQYGQTYQKIYPATGSLIDWAYYKGIKHSYAIETRDNGQFGFLIPAEDIEDTGKEIYAAINVLGKILDPPVMSRGEDHELWF